MRIKTHIGLFFLGHLSAQRCPILVPPENAETVCQIESDGTEICQVFCDDGFTFAESTRNQFSCLKGNWQPEPNLPSCVDKSLLKHGGFLNRSGMLSKYYFKLSDWPTSGPETGSDWLREPSRQHLFESHLRISFAK